jgi:hypothetical protein
MITIEKVSNGYIVRVEEDETDDTLVFQREFDSMNLALLAVFKHMQNLWQEDEGPQIKLDYGA